MVVTVGDTTGELPDTKNVPVQEPVYHFHDAPEPKVPPVIPRVELAPEQIVAGETVTLAATTDKEFTVIAVLTQLVVEQVPMALTQYVVLTIGL